MKFTANFIKATESFNTFEKNVPAPYFRKSFNTKAASQAEIKVAVCGFYKLFINGKDVTKGALAPYISNPDDIVYCDCYTVDLKRGKNVIGIVLGNGFINNPGGWIWLFDKAKFRSAPYFALQLTSGDFTLESDESFKCAPSPIIFDDYRYGEHYDANLELAGWNLPDFDDSSWANALPAKRPSGEIRLCEAEPITVAKTLKPVSFKKVDNGYLYDFGQNCSGVCRLNINGKKGQVVELQHGELLIDGKMDIEYIWFPYNEKGVHWDYDKKFVHKDIYVCKGEKNETYIPSFTYHGFQYVTVYGITEEQATEDLLTYLVMNSDLKHCGSFSTSNKTVAALYDAAIRSDLANFYYFPTDCPQREKNGWTADASLSSEQIMLNFDASVSFREWLRNICKAQNNLGALPGIIPTTGGFGYDWGNGPAWDSVLAYLPYYCYKYRGDKQVIRECSQAFIKYLKYLKTRSNKDGLLEIGLGDWCQIGERYEEIKAPLIVTDTIMAIDIANKTAFMLSEIGLKDESDFARSMSAEYRRCFRENLIDFKTMTVSGACQTSQAMAIYYGILDKSEKKAAFERLLDFIKAADDHIDSGVLGARIIFRLLSDFGYSDLAFKMITRPDFPSYAYNCLTLNLNTLPEKFSKEPVDSLNHHFWGDVIAWFTIYLAGLNYNPDADDLNRIDITPHIVDGLADAAAHYDSVSGKIKTSWVKIENGNVELKVTVPQGMHGVIKPQNGYIFADGTSEKPAASGVYTLVK